MNKANLFFLSIVISMLGNAVADYAILWHAIHSLDFSTASVFSNQVSAFYVGQAFGAVFLAPNIAVFLDRISNYKAAIVLDLLYGFILIVAIVLHKLDKINVLSVLSLVVLISSISMVYRSFVGFAAIKNIQTEKNKLVPKFIKAISLSHLAGAGLSGAFYHWLGFQGAMLFGVVTFIPALLVYKYVLENKNRKKVKDTNFKTDFKQGLILLKKDRFIFNTLIAIMLFNVVGAIIPSVLGMKFKMLYQGRSDLFGLAIASGLFIGFIFTNYLDRLSKSLKISTIIVVSIVPIVIMSILAFLFGHLVYFLGIYFCACIASALRNVATGSLRVSRIPSEHIAKVNTVYMSVLYFGQFIGGVFVLPLFTFDFNLGLSMFVLIMMISIIFTVFKVPNERLINLI